VDQLQLSPLHYAAWADRRECAEILLQNDAAIDAQDQQGDTALHLAAMTNASEAVRDR
jgi:ankyrin repeat protein